MTNPIGKMLEKRLVLYAMLRKAILRARARLSGKTFACRALSGLSGYNICINSDLSMSCNCQDYDGSGLLGYLDTQTLAEIFSGVRAQDKRRALASLQFPVLVCPVCSDLMMVDRQEVDRHQQDFQVPTKGLMVENTVLCNLACRGCKRGELLLHRRKTSMTVADVEKVAKAIAEYKIANIAFFNLGEPFMSPHVAQEIAIMRRHNPAARIYTSTNGIFLDNESKMQAAMQLDHIYFSIDGATQQDLAKYQVNGNFQVSYENMKKFVVFRNDRGGEKPVIEWKYVLFRWNDCPRKVEAAVEMAKMAGVDRISFWPGGATFSYKPYRYYLLPFWRRFGMKSWKGREIDFRQQRIA